MPIYRGSTKINVANFGSSGVVRAYYNGNIVFGVPSLIKNLFVSSPGKYDWEQNVPVDVTLPAAYTNVGSPAVTYKLTGLPQGLTFDASTRKLTGIPTELSSGIMLYVASATGYISGSGSIGWHVASRERTLYMQPKLGKFLWRTDTDRSPEHESHILAVPSIGSPDIQYSVKGAPAGVRYDELTKTFRGTPSSTKTVERSTYAPRPEDSPSRLQTRPITISAFQLDNLCNCPRIDQITHGNREWRSTSRCPLDRKAAGNGDPGLFIDQDCQMD